MRRKMDAHPPQRRTDQYRRTFTSQGQSTEKTYHASQNCGHQCLPPTKGQNPSDHSFASGNSTAGDLGNLFVEEIHHNRASPQNTHPQDHINPISACPLIRPAGKMLGMVRCPFEENNYSTGHTTTKDSITDTRKNIGKVFFIRIFFCGFQKYRLLYFIIFLPK